MKVSAGAKSPDNDNAMVYNTMTIDGIHHNKRLRNELPRISFRLYIYMYISGNSTKKRIGMSILEIILYWLYPLFYNTRASD